jgi:hypothetical protein
MLLHEWSKLLKFRPAAATRQHVGPLTPLSDWLAKVKLMDHAVWVEPDKLEFSDPPAEAAQQ